MNTFVEHSDTDLTDIICATRKTAKQTLKVRCKTSAAAEALKKMDWNQFASGAALIKPRYEIVIHGASKEDVSFNSSHITEDHTIREIETTNLKGFKIEKITPLRKYARNPNAPTQSIVLQLNSPEEADECFMNGIFIGKRLHHLEKYMLQFQIKQCFNCYSYGHIAGDCSKGGLCGKCGKDNHKTKECQEPKAKCVHCEGEHAAWHNLCPTRKHELTEKLEEQRARQSPYFTQ